jgi:hypothetical protein
VDNLAKSKPVIGELYIPGGHTADWQGSNSFLFVCEDAFRNEANCYLQDLFFALNRTVPTLCLTAMKSPKKNDHTMSKSWSVQVKYYSFLAGQKHVTTLPITEKLFTQYFKKV